MTVTTTKDNNTVTVAVEGSIDTLTAPELEHAISEAIPACDRIILDMSGVDYISSAGLRVVVGANQNIGKDNLTLRGVSQNVYEIFRMTGFTKFLNIE